MGDDNQDAGNRSRSPSPWKGDSTYEERDYKEKERARSRSAERETRRNDDDQDQNPGDNLYVTGLSLKTRSEDLEEAFAKVGPVKKAEVVIDPHSRESRGFAFVRMETVEDADAAKERLSGTEIDGRVITVEKARRSKPRNPTPGRYQGPARRDYTRRDDRYDGRGGGRYGDRDRDRYEPRGRYNDRYEDRDRGSSYRDRDRGDRGYDRGGYDRDRGYDRGDRDRGFERGDRDRGDRGRDREDRYDRQVE